MARYVIKRDRSALPERLTRYKSELNDEQFRVVTAPPKAALVVAGAGTGKTRAITYRVAYLIEQGVSPQSILLATFTNRAAREMLRRVESLTGSNNVHRVWGGTFHRIANLILRRHAVSIGFDQNYSILDSEDARELISVCVDDAGVDTKAQRFPKAEVILGIISYANNTDMAIEDVVALKYPYFEPLTAPIKRVAMLYQTRKQERNVMDYDDLLLNVKRLLVEKPAIGDLYAEQFQHILVDEYQDTNRLQAEIIDLLAVKHRNVMVVGDDAQSIFAWRGAEFSNIYEFPKRYPDAQVFKLETNYRSTPEILGLANTSIACNRKQFPKVLTAVRRSRDIRPALVPCSDVEQQSAFVASRILELRDEGTSLEDMAVLYRSHYHSIELQLELSRRNIPYRVQSGVRFFEQAHIKDVISYLRIIINPRDELAWKRILKMIPGIGNKTANRIYDTMQTAEPALLQDTGEISESITLPGNFSASRISAPPNVREKATWKAFIALLELLVADENRGRPSKQIGIILTSGYEQYLHENFENAEARIEDLKGLASFADRYSSTEEFLSELALLSTERFKEPTPLVGEEVISGGDDDELLTLTSVHQAKGLEWKAVFIIWAAEGKFPSPKSLREIDSEEEERRLWYVAMTRAKDELYLTYPLLMTDYNRQTVLQKPSRFVTECPALLYEIWDLEEEQTAFDAPVLLNPSGTKEFIN
ncbi:MAG TPA: ATP-dependent helicase [Pyrinomonadaceae bacterium]|nr:ATP-dependent helicase [Chloracidobacterium sp.]MBP9108021.1 ATP-dependent helicase [Pyrinomonadaceae bacterium]MBL0242277.1 ATP-dependent helicase [Chloracidobacterium sp.]HQX56144.1 ATP-dependent helicase [Pyrinomonadaceae bacterium]HQY66950.1 ATP-dependent helicase [Pyrinomonadaceae bacterium]